MAKRIVEEARRRAYPWAEQFHEYADDREAEPGSVCYVIPVPGRPNHTLSLLQRGDTIEVAYDDGVPPGPAEAQFIAGPAEEADDVGNAFDFVDDIFAGRVTAVREPLPWWVRLMRRDCDSLLRFQKTENPDASPR